MRNNYQKNILQIINIFFIIPRINSFNRDEKNDGPDRQPDNMKILEELKSELQVITTEIAKFDTIIYILIPTTIILFLIIIGFSIYEITKCMRKKETLLIDDKKYFSQLMDSSSDSSSTKKKSNKNSNNNEIKNFNENFSNMSEISLNNNTTKDNTNDINMSNSEEEVIQIFQECYLVLQKIYENLILQLLFNENFNKAKKNEDKNEICEKYINEFFIFTQKPKNNEQIINKINENIYLIIKGLSKSIKLILEYLKLSGIKFDEANKENPELIKFEINETEEVFSDSIKNLDNINELNTIVNLCNFYIDQKSDIFQKFTEKVALDQYKCFNLINAYFNLIISKSKLKINKNKKKTIPNKIVKKPLVISPSLYKKIQICVYIYYDNFKILLEKNKIKVPFLPPMDTSKYKYTLVLDLDETLVHYIEEKDRHYVQVRPFAEYFISEMGKYFELVIFTSAEEEYANVVLEEIDKNKVITYKLYRRHVEYNDGFCLKDLNKIGRDLRKVCIIDNDKNNFKLQTDNGIEIKEFLGEQDDNELDLLGDLLMSIIESNLDDIRPIIKDIRSKMNKINEEKSNIDK